MKEKIFTVFPKDFDVQTSKGSGPGGQHRNKVESAVKIVHKKSGAIGESRTERSQYRNKQIAKKRLVESKKFKLWVQRRVWEITEGKTLDQKVLEQMRSENLKIEYF